MYHETYMRRCIDLAANGLGSTAPNPLVGAVVVRDGRIVGEGYHTAIGRPHAEVEAIRQVGDDALLEGSTLYVNLEPCSHHGRTPPCTELIISKKIGLVVIGQPDPNPEAAGGARLLREQGIEVVEGVLEAGCRFLNRRFNSHHERHRPWIILKWAQTADGFVDRVRLPGQNLRPAWITDETCRRLVHRWRSEEQAILAGSRTILLDNPVLNVRSWTGKDPLRLTIDRNGLLANQPPGTVRILDGSIPTLVYTNRASAFRPNLEFVGLDSNLPVWPQVFADLHSRGIQSVLVEGGPTLLSTLIHEEWWDEARVFTGPGWFGEGVRAPVLAATPEETLETGNSRLLHFFRQGVKTMLSDT